MRSWGSFRYVRNAAPLLKGVILCVYLILLAPIAQMATIHEYRDTISDSAPDEYSNHTIEFTTTVAIPASGYVRFIPEPGDFTIPVTDFDYKNVELSVDTGSGFQIRQASTTPDATNDGITITTGLSGNVEVTLNSTEGIPSGSRIRLHLGNETENSTSTDTGLLNPNAIGTYEYYIEAGGGSVDESVLGKIAIVNNVSVGPVDTRELNPPVRFNGAPSGVLSGTTLTVQMSLETDEFARCRYSTASGTPYFSMGNEFASTFVTVHTRNVSVATSTSYDFYVRCIDDEGNVNTDDYLISFTIPEYPTGTPGSDGENEGEGSGTGEGSGEADPGEGDPDGGDDSSGGSSGGGSGGGGGGGSGSSSSGDDGGGGFENSGNPYQSGDARVIINGYAFPNSTIVVLVDGVKAREVRASNSGSFSATLDEIARGVYTFGVYAVDRNGTRSSTFSTTFSVVGSRGSTLSNVNVMPSIKVTPDPVNPGSTVTFSGYSIPNATITLENMRDKSSQTLKSFTTTSDGSGSWSFDTSTEGFPAGTYKVRAKAVQSATLSTNFSDYTFYGVGQAAEVPRSSDLNRDGRVNLTDFSILLFWWNSDGGASNPPADINGDGRVSLTDFSIMVFNWTG